MRGAPTGWTLPVREVRASVGAGFVYPICGAMSTMPGLGASPALQRIDIDADGNAIWQLPTYEPAKNTPALTQPHHKLLMLRSICYL